MSARDDIANAASFFYNTKINGIVSLKIAPLVAGAGTRWVFRVRLNYNTRRPIAEGKMKWSITDKSGVKSVCQLDEDRMFYGYSRLLEEIVKSTSVTIVTPSVSKAGVVRLTLGDKVLRDEKYDRKSGVAPLSEILGVDDVSTGTVDTKPLDGNLSVPYFILCSLAPASYVNSDKSDDMARVCHAYSPEPMDFDNLRMCEEISEWMPVNKEYPEDTTVTIKVRSAQGTTIVFGVGSSVTLELKQV